MKGLSEETHVPLKWIFALISGSVGMLSVVMAIGFWVSKVESRTMESERSLVGMQEENKDNSVLLRKIDQRLSRIEGRLGIEPKSGEEK